LITLIFLLSHLLVFSCTEAARCYPSTTDAPSHDCFTRLLQKQPSDTEPLWDEVRNQKRLVLFVISGVKSIIVVLRELVLLPCSGQMAIKSYLSWATDVLDMDESEREDLANKSWKIEEYHRAIKQFCGVKSARQEKKNHREHM
jgi:hypothetical protein